MFPHGIPAQSISAILFWLFAACLCTLSGDWSDWKSLPLPVDADLRMPGRGFPEDFCY